METCLHFRGAALNARETGFSYVYLVMPDLIGHLLYNIRVYNYVTG